MRGKPYFLARAKSFGIVGGRAFHRPGPEAHIDIGIRHQGQFLPVGGIDDFLPDEILVALVFRVHENRGVAEHRLRTGRRDDHFLVAIHHVVGEIEEFAFIVFVDDLDVA
jgi:hypothetical protein